VRVTLVEQDRVGAHASGGSAGLLTVHPERVYEGAFGRLARVGRDRFAAYAPQLREETGIDIELQQDGLLTLVPPAEAAEARRSASEDIRWLEAAEIQELEPEVGSRWAGGLFSTRDGQVNTGRLTAALSEGAARRGTVFREAERVTGLVEDGRSVRGVRTSAGTLRADAVVIAAGPWSGLLGELIHVPISVYPVKGQLVWARTRPVALRRPIYASGCYLAPKVELGIAIGATEEHLGFDERPTLAPVAALIGAAVRACPALADAELVGTWASLRPASADGLPILGPVPDRPGLIIATGHFRNGILLSLISGELVANWVLGRSQPVDVSPFLPRTMTAAEATAAAP
jgi:glycine oxidase